MSSKLLLLGSLLVVSGTSTIVYGLRTYSSLENFSSEKQEPSTRDTKEDGLDWKDIDYMLSDSSKDSWGFLI